MYMQVKGIIKIVISMGYTVIIGWLISLTDLSFNSGVLIAALIMITLGSARLNNGAPVLPVVERNSHQNTMDSSDIRNTVDMNVEIATAERDMPGKRQFMKKGLLRDLLIVRTGLEMVAAGVIVALVAFAPFYRYFI